MATQITNSVDVVQSATPQEVVFPVVQTTNETVDNYIQETFRLDGSQNGISTVITAAGGEIVGDTLLVNAPFASLSLVELRGCAADDGTGTLSSVIVDGVQYNLGEGLSFPSRVKQFVPIPNGVYSQPVQISCTGGAKIEVTVVRNI